MSCKTIDDITFETITYIIDKRQWQFIKDIDDFNLSNSHGECLLSHFIDKSNVQAIEFLIKKGANLNFPINIFYNTTIRIINLIKQFLIKYKVIPILYSYKKNLVKEENWDILCLDCVKYILSILLSDLLLELNKFISYKTRRGYCKIFKKDETMLLEKFNLKFNDLIATPEGIAKIVGFSPPVGEEINGFEYLWFDLGDGGASYWSDIKNIEDLKLKICYF